MTLKVLSHSVDIRLLLGVLKFSSGNVALSFFISFLNNIRVGGWYFIVASLKYGTINDNEVRGLGVVRHFHLAMELADKTRKFDSFLLGARITVERKTCQVRSLLLNLLGKSHGQQC